MKTKPTLYFYQPKSLCLVGCLLLLVCFSCRQKMDGSHAAYIDSQLKLVADSVLVRGRVTPAEFSFLQTIHAKAPGVGLNQLALKYIVVGNFLQPDEKRIAYADSAISLLEHNFTGSEKTALLLARATTLKGTIYLNQKYYDEALRDFMLCKIALSQVKDSCYHVTYHENMARILFAQNKFTGAASHFKTVVAITAKCKPFQAFAIIQENISNVGVCYDKANMPDSAEYYYEAALKFISENQNKYPGAPEVHKRIPLMQAVINSNLGDLSLRQKEYKKAESLLTASIEITKSLEKRLTIGSRLSLLNLYLQTADSGKAKAIITKLDTTVDTAGISNITAKFYRMRSQYKQLTGEPSPAFNDLMYSYSIRDSLEKRDRQFNATDVAREFENKEQRSINEALQKNNRLQQSYLWIFLISTLLASVIALLVWYNLKRKSHYVGKLEKLNKKIELKNDHLQDTMHSLEESHKENKRLMRAVAHDLRNPLGAIRTLAFSLAKKDMPEHVKEDLQLIQTTCKDSLSFIKDLLDNKGDRPGQRKEIVDIEQLIQHCTEVLQWKADEKQQQLTLQLKRINVPANPEKIYRVISNLVNNAIKFSPEHSEIIISAQRKDVSVLISVKDSGIGIPDNIKDKILTISPEGSRKGTHGEESYGIGLSICQKIVKEHHGSMGFESKEGEGSVFYFELPLHHSPVIAI